MFHVNEVADTEIAATSPVPGLRSWTESTDHSTEQSACNQGVVPRIASRISNAVESPEASKGSLNGSSGRPSHHSIQALSAINACRLSYFHGVLSEDRHE
jgi:hypothetical protein